VTRTKPISELTKNWSKDRLDLVEERVNALKEEIALTELRKARSTHEGRTNHDYEA